MGIMPPKPKFSKNEIIRSALDLVRENGPESLTAREVGKRLGVSSSPIFTFFKDMDELKNAVKVSAKEKFDEYMLVAENFYPSYKKRGMQFVRFAGEEPQLFKLLFMEKGNGDKSFDLAIECIPFGKQDDINIIKRDYAANDEQALRLFDQMWIYTYGLCVLTATGVCSFSEKETAQRLGEIFRGMVEVIHSDPNWKMGILPIENTDEGLDQTKKQSPKFNKQ